MIQVIATNLQTCMAKLQIVRQTLFPPLSSDDQTLFSKISESSRTQASIYAEQWTQRAWIIYTRFQAFDDNKVYNFLINWYCLYLLWVLNSRKIDIVMPRIFQFLSILIHTYLIYQIFSLGPTFT